MSKTKSQQIIEKSTDKLIASTFGCVIIYSLIACLQILSVSVGV